MVKKPNYFTVSAALRELGKIELCRHLDNVHRMDPAVTKELKEMLDKQKALQSEELMKAIAGSSRSYEDILRHIKGRAVRRRRLKTEQRAGLIGLMAPSERHVRLVVKSLEVHNLH